MDFALFLNQLFNGFSLASLYLLASLGLALSFGIMRVINMAHGEMLMLGGYLAWLTLLVVPGGAGILLAVPVAFAGAAAMGGLIQTSLIRRLSSRPLDTLLATWGVSLILQQAARDLFGAIGVEVRAPDWLMGSFTVAGVTLPSARLFIIAVAVLVLGALALVLLKTRIGLLTRAVNQDRMMASAVGIDVKRVDFTVFCLGSGIAGLAGVMLALLGPVTPNVGQSYIIPAFLVVVMGGLGSIVGTTTAAIVLGVFSALAQMFVDVSVAQMLLLVFVILFIQIRPQGVVAVRTRQLDV
ncbi:urea ABC transporter permease subunit UrtB [Novosphingobium album (ex Liu et al. 2023)]|uniref:Urea ABC transporter permease subunit UrtB n=1 Tax=Novosphingobium album (ex Liu et al. 2023) TaxID=3031130 RepID=A0ABT5WUN7_9SPHN|nr:urea ABC transporter permease subunit UrtB [Novosphingobium album (ex Liu et al. 2023)]MDE8653572.1 urea ABC transporter permease subunit UrtB [Novosphingobium album (ex Liu et al. 2023)]